MKSDQRIKIDKSRGASHLSMDCGSASFLVIVSISSVTHRPFILLLSSQDNHRNLTSRLRLMIGKKWVQFNYPGPQPLPFRTLCDDGDSLEGLVSYLDGDFWVSQQVAIPVRVGRRTSVGGDPEQAVAIGYIPYCGSQEIPLP